MSEETIRWLFITIGSWLLIVTGGVFHLIVKLAKLETLLSMKSRTASKILHSPTDHFNIDDLLDKHHDGTITQTEWLELEKACNAIVADKDASQIERWLASAILSDPKNGVRKT